jgi:hypothetical protein
MKTRIITLSAVAFAAILGMASTAFARSTLVAMAPVIAAVTPSPLVTPPPAPITPSPTATPTVEALFEEAGTTIESSTQDHREGLSDLGDRVNRSIKEQIDTWKSQGFTAPLPMDEQVSRALLDFTQKLSLLSLASEETWTSVKTDTISSLRHLQGVYADLAAASAKRK